MRGDAEVHNDASFHSLTSWLTHWCCLFATRRRCDSYTCGTIWTWSSNAPAEERVQQSSLPDNAQIFSQSSSNVEHPAVSSQVSSTFCPLFCSAAQCCLTLCLFRKKCAHCGNCLFWDTSCCNLQRQEHWNKHLNFTWFSGGGIVFDPLYCTWQATLPVMKTYLTTICVSLPRMDFPEPQTGILPSTDQIPTRWKTIRSCVTVTAG